MLVISKPDTMALVRATVGVVFVKFWDFSVALTKGGEGYPPRQNLFSAICVSFFGAKDKTGLIRHGDKADQCIYQTSLELPNITAYAYQDVHVWSAL